MDTFIHAIYLYDDKVLITLNYKEGGRDGFFRRGHRGCGKGKKFGYGLPWCTTAATATTGMWPPFLFCTKRAQTMQTTQTKTPALPQRESGGILIPTSQAPTRAGELARPKAASEGA